MNKSDYDRFFSYISPEPNTGCWLWKAATVRGYGRIRIAGKQLHAHRIAFEIFKGTIPTGLHLDHLCRVPCCVNPAHLEAVTCRVNILRGVSVQAKNAKKTHCNHGHEFTLENTRRYRGGRVCKTCARRNETANRRRKGEKPRQKNTHCSRGHELAGSNLYTATSGKRQCKTCNAMRKRISWAGGA